MVYSKDELNKLLKSFLLKVNESGIMVQEAYLYGSYAKGIANDNSDIDVAVISGKFEGNRVFDRAKMVEAKWDTSAAISPMPFRPEDFTDDDWLVQEIKKTGIRLV